MMRSSRGSWAVAVVFALSCGPAMAQTGIFGGTGTPSGGQSQVPLPVQMYGNPLLNPYLNPYAATQLRGTSPDAALYFYSASQMNGGIGSGVISGTRVAPGVPAGSVPQGRSQGQTGAPTTAKPPRPTDRPMGDRRAARPAAEMPMSTAVPGASAARYFNRGPQPSEGAATYYNRNQSRFQNNGR